METKRILVIFALMMVCIAGAGFAATTGSSTSGTGTSTNSGTAVLQITGYSTVPATVYPGTSGYATFTVQNTGTDTATAVTVQYGGANDLTPSTMPSGDISAGSTTQITVPFKMPQDVPGGLYALDINVYYSSLTAGGTSKETSTSIPLIAAQYGALEVTTLAESKKVLAPGDTLQLNLEVTNKGGVVNNLAISTPDNSSFTLQGTTEQSVGSIASGNSMNVTLMLASSSSTTVGQYTIPLVFTYQDALGVSDTQTLYVGPVSVLAPSTQYRLSMEPLTPTEVGSQAVFALTLQNTGTNPLSAIVDVNSTTAFTPLGVTRIYFDTLEGGESSTQNVSVGISNSITEGYYTLPLEVALSSGTSSEQNIGIPVTATPELVVSTTTTPTFLTPGSSAKIVAQISNTGNAAIRSVYVVAENGNFQISGTADKFVGTLNVDDFTTFQLDVNVPRNMAAGEYTLPISVSFKDTDNVPHVINESVKLQVYDAASGAALNANSGNASATASGFSRGRSSGVIFGLSWIEIGGGVVVLIVAGYFVRRHLINKKRQQKMKGLMQ